MYFVFKRFKNENLNYIYAINAANHQVAESRLSPYREWRYEIVLETEDWEVAMSEILKLRGEINE